jgi:tetratricopeptide (TPR) repeat protein
VADDIRALSAALASDPSSLVYVELAEALRRKGHLAEAMKAVMHGLGRNPNHPDGYDALARIHADKAQLSEARAAWERALAIDPEHTGALKGLGFLYFKEGDSFRAQDVLERAVAADPSDDQARRALAMVLGAQTPGASGAPEIPRTAEQVPQLRATAQSMQPVAAPEPPRTTRAIDRIQLTDEEKARRAAASAGAPERPAAGAPQEPERPPVFEGLEGANADILLLDARGLVMAGGLRNEAGADVSELAAAALAGVSGEASRTTGYLQLGEWSVIVAEAEQANVVLSPLGEGALLMARRDKSTPVGLAIRIAERARNAAARWLAGQG